MFPMLKARETHLSKVQPKTSGGEHLKIRFSKYVCVTHTHLHNYGQSKKKNKMVGMSLRYRKAISLLGEQCFTVICDSWYNISDFNKQKIKIVYK